MELQGEDIELVVRFADGSGIRRDRDTDEIAVDSGIATTAMACAVRAIDRPVLETLTWFRGEAPELHRDADTVDIGNGTRFNLGELRAAIGAAYMERWRDESLWLLRPDSIACVPSEGDRMFAEQLEERVAAFDAAVATGELGDPREGARRKIIHAELRAAGILDEPLLGRKIEVLDELGSPHLRSLAIAAQTLRDYYLSPERARFVRKPVPSTVHDGLFSLDWVRSVKAPEGVPLFTLWAVIEDGVNITTPGERGPYEFGTGRLRVWMKWRLEDGTRRVLYTATVQMKPLG